MYVEHNTNLDFLNLLTQSPNISIRFIGSLLQFHHRDHGVCLISQHTNYCMKLQDNTIMRFH